MAGPEARAEAETGAVLPGASAHGWEVKHQSGHLPRRREEKRGPRIRPGNTGRRETSRRSNDRQALEGGVGS